MPFRAVLRRPLYGLVVGALLTVVGCLTLCPASQAQDSAEVLEGPPASPALPPPPVLPGPVSPVTINAIPLNDQRILGVIPDYQTVNETKGKAAPLTVRQKWDLALKETVDPFNIASAAMAAAFSQKGNQTPKYGEGGPAYGERFIAANADFATQNFFSAGLLASVLHQDPRYFRKGPESRVFNRIFYSLSRLVIARQDAGGSAFNTSGIGGMMMGIAASNLYYPSKSVSARVMAGRIETSLFGGATGNLMSEFWPDIQKKFFQKKFLFFHTNSNKDN